MYAYAYANDYTRVASTGEAIFEQCEGNLACKGFSSYDLYWAFPGATSLRYRSATVSCTGLYVRETGTS